MSAGTGGRAVGIDLGTSNSVVAAVIDGEAIVIADRQGQTIHPSVVSWLPDGRTLVGTAAKARMSSDPDHTVYSVKRLVGRPSRSEEVKVAQRKYAYRIVADGDEAPRVQVQDRNFTVEEVQALILRHMKRVAEEYLGEPVTRAVITVPANFNEAQRRATRMAGSLAGLEVLRILNEPTAAALAYGYEQDLRERIAVYDLGGGTFDVTILELRDNVLEVLSTAGDTFLGGDDFDMRLTDLLAQEFEKATGIALSQDQTAMQRLKSTSEQVKIQLSEALEAQATITHRVPQQPQPVQATVTITRQAFNRACQQLVQKSFLVCDEALKLAEITSAEVDRLVLVGGATRIPMVREMVEQYFFKKPLLDINPDEVVAVGAAIYAFGLDMQAGPPMPPQPPQRVPQASGPETALGSFPPADAPAPMEGGTAPTARGLPNVPRTQTMGAAPPPIPGQSATLLGNPPPPPPPPAGTRRLGALPPPPPRMGAPAPRTPAQDTPGAGRPGHATTSGSLPIAPDGGLRGLPGNSADPSQVAWQPPAPARAAGPLLIDVIPQALGIQTVGGYMDTLIERNSRLPIRQTRTFGTASDNQAVVRINILEGSSRVAADNRPLGELLLSDIPLRARGDVKIDVSFEINTDGMLSVTARDRDSGRLAHTRLNVAGTISDEALARLQATDLPEAWEGP